MESALSYLPKPEPDWIQEGEKEQTSWGLGLRPETICLRLVVSDLSSCVHWQKSRRRVGLEMVLTLTPRGACWKVKTAVCQIELGALKLKIHIYFNRLGCLEGGKGRVDGILQIR